MSSSNLLSIYQVNPAVDLNDPQAIMSFTDGNTKNTPFKNNLTEAQEGLCISVKTFTKWNAQFFIVNGVGAFTRYISSDSTVWSSWKNYELKS